MTHDVNKRGFSPDDYQVAAKMGGLKKQVKCVECGGSNNLLMLNGDIICEECATCGDMDFGPDNKFGL